MKNILFGENHESCFETLSKLFNLVMASFCFDKLVKIPENASDLQNSLVNNTEKERYRHSTLLKLVVI